MNALRFAYALFLCALVPSPLFAVTTVDQLDQNDPASWVLKSVCQPSSGSLLAVDPYGGCPSGSTLRKIQPGDALPYNNYEQMGYQISDSFPLLDGSWNPLWLHTFDYAPFNQFNLHSGSDGYDVYSLSGGDVSIPNTRDGGGSRLHLFRQRLFFGPRLGALPQDPLHFPRRGLLRHLWGLLGAESAVVARRLSGWLLDQYARPPGSSTPARPVRRDQRECDEVDAGPDFLPRLRDQRRHHPDRQLPEAGPPRGVRLHARIRPDPLGGVDPAGAASHGRQQGRVQRTGDGQLQRPAVDRPVLPRLVSGGAAGESGAAQRAAGQRQAAASPPLRRRLIRRRWHRDWHRFGTSEAGLSINWSLLNSTSGGDNQNGSGLRYLALNCGASGGTGCRPGGTEAIYQDIPAGGFCSGCGLLYGIDARSESGSGTLQAAIQVLDGAGHVIWQDVSGATLGPDNGDGRPGESSSVYRSSAFVGIG